MRHILKAVQATLIRTHLWSLICTMNRGTLGMRLLDSDSSEFSDICPECVGIKPIWLSNCFGYRIVVHGCLE